MREALGKLYVEQFPLEPLKNVSLEIYIDFVVTQVYHLFGINNHI